MKLKVKCWKGQRVKSKAAVFAAAWIAIFTCTQAQSASQDNPATSTVPQASAPTVAQAELAAQTGTCGNGKPGRWLNHPTPNYPSDAAPAHVEGTVTLHAHIGTDGTVQKLDYVSGPQALVGAAIDAAKQWTFEPCSADGKPTEIDTTMAFDFIGNQCLELRVDGTSLRIARLIRFVAPVYPRKARWTHVEGIVLLHGTISKDGTVKDLQFISGPSMLAKAAIDAVKQWRYEPMVLNGNPVDVNTTIRVNFDLR